jgi:hypothetical protein
MNQSEKSASSGHDIGPGEQIPERGQEVQAQTHTREEDLMEAQVRARYLRSLCHKLQTADETHAMRPLERGLAIRVDVIAEMIADLVGLKVEEIYELFDRGDGTGEGLMQLL